MSGAPGEGGASRRPAAAGIVALGLFVVIGGALIFGFGSALGPALSQQQEAACRPLQPVSQDRVAPPLAAEDLRGAPVNLEQFRGKLVILNFWATWCEPCVAEWPQIDRLAERLAEAGHEDVEVVAVSIDKSRDDILPFLERMSLANTKVKVVWDPTQAVNKAYGSEKIPDTYVVDRGGRIQQVYVNTREWGRPAAFHCVRSLADR
ncbi:MAG: TlpA disulfide reductase family protein [Nannocystaceae bacterium]